MSSRTDSDAENAPLAPLGTGQQRRSDGVVPRTSAVILVGAGPGDPGLITVRGQNFIRAADVIAYDQLGAPNFLSEARADAELIDVGKWAGQHTMPQEAINDVLIERARAGKLVVRLKGGDPMMFGRGGEELQALAAAGLPFEVVPGISSAIAGPTYAGIPITHRDCTAALAVVTGHESSQKTDSAIPWTSLGGIGTVVFLMGVKNLPNIARRLMDAGKSPETPVAIIEQATTPSQRTTTGTLATIADRGTAAGVKPPALIVVGEVVRFHETLDWFGRRPLFGRTIAVTRSRAQASDLCQRLHDLGARVFECPTICVELLVPNLAFDAFLDDLPNIRDLVFTSVNGVEGFISNLRQRGLDLRATAGKNLVCIGPATAKAFSRRDIAPDFVPETYVAEALVPWFASRPTAHVAILRAEEAREVLPEALTKLGYWPRIVPLYRTIADRPNGEDVIEALRCGEVDAVTFTSSSTVDKFLEMLQGTGIDPSIVPAVTIGPVTHETARAQGFRLLGSASVHTIDGLVNELRRLLEKS